MGTSAKGLLKNLWQPQLQFVRFKGKINITKPRPPHFARAVVETVCMPYFKEKKKPTHIPNYDLCVGPLKKIQKEPDHPLELILARETLNWFKNSKMIAFFHQNTMTSEEKFQNQLTTKKGGMKLLFFKNSILKKGLCGSIYESLLQLYEGPTATAFSPEVNISSLLKISKKLPKLVLMAAVVDDRLLSYSELQHLGRFESILDAQSNLLSSLNLASQSIVQQISHHPSNFVGLLNQHENLLKDVEKVPGKILKVKKLKTLKYFGLIKLF